jgi:anti-sigma-K factor RskA
MRRPGDPLIDLLAAEYVLGTLRGRARARFERWRRNERPESGRIVEAAIRRWEDRLANLADGVEPVQPSSRVWREIERRIRAPQRAARARDAAAWRGWALAAGIALVALGAWLWVGRAPDVQWQAAAELRDAGQPQPLWQVEVDRERTRLRVSAKQPYGVAQGESHELWALPAGDGAPVSLGLLPQLGSVERELSAAQRDALRAATRLAVSREPAGGSPTGAPTGPVLIVTELPAAG